MSSDNDLRSTKHELQCVSLGAPAKSAKSLGAPAKSAKLHKQNQQWLCLSTHAVHLEVPHSLTTDAAIMAIRRRIARRGCPKEIHSDNGTNLRGAEKELQTAVASLNQRKIRAEMIAKAIK